MPAGTYHGVDSGVLWIRGKQMSYYVYFIQRDRKGNQPVKIGYSKDPDLRIKDLQVANCDKLKIALTIPFETEELAREAERTMHWLARKKHRKLNGEWFLIYGSWKKFIAECMKIYDKNQGAKTLYMSSIV